MSQKDFRNELKRIFTDYKRITPQIESGERKIMSYSLSQTRGEDILFQSARQAAIKGKA